jgi:hypothetical protein
MEATTILIVYLIFNNVTDQLLHISGNSAGY